MYINNAITLRCIYCINEIFCICSDVRTHIYVIVCMMMHAFIYFIESGYSVKYSSCYKGTLKIIWPTSLTCKYF